MFDEKSEAEIQANIQTTGPAHNCILMRNNSGALLDKDGRPVRYGLGNISKAHNDKIKSSDLIGFTTITVTQDMVGKKIAIFTAVEVKNSVWNPNKDLTRAKDGRERAQLAFITWIKNAGGIAGFASSVEAFKQLLQNFKQR